MVQISLHVNFTNILRFILFTHPLAENTRFFFSFLIIYQFAGDLVFAFIEKNSLKCLQ